MRPQRLLAAQQRDVSKMPGETVVPASATRTGWKTCLGLAPRGARPRRAARLRPSSVNGSSAGERLARLLRAARAAVGVEPLLARLGVVGAGPSKRKPASGQKSASVWIFSCEISTAGAQPVAAR